MISCTGNAPSGRSPFPSGTMEASIAQLEGTSLWLFPSSMRGHEISQILRDGFDINLLNEGLQALLDEFDLDCLLIDTHPGLNEETLLSIAISDLLIVCCAPITRISRAPP
jgi:MinD-like ATPase involved in chromosome partitioning or flagellar assembly